METPIATYVILAGGHGERLWPLTSHDNPKHLLPFIDKRSLLEQTVHRLKPMLNRQEHIIVVANKAHEKKISELLSNEPVSIMSEQATRNTAPAILSTCLALYKKNPDGVIAFFPSDHFIPDKNSFNELVSHACRYASTHDVFVILGVRPAHPATGYGYIAYDATGVFDDALYPVIAFHEKPSLGRAEQYMTDPCMLWNIGIFIGKISTFLHQAYTHAPELMAFLEAYNNGLMTYDNIPTTSFDYAIMEKTREVVVLPANIVWHDVGNLDSFITLQQKYQKESSNTIISCNSHDNIAYARHKHIVFVGVNNMCLVETEDTLLVISRDNVEQVRQAKAQVGKSE